MKPNRRKGVFSAFLLALLYTLTVFATLYFTPFISIYLTKHLLLQSFMSGFYLASGIAIVTLFLYRYRVSNLKAYGYFSLLLILFLIEFVNTPRLIERIHFIEYALLYAVWFRVFRHFYRGVVAYGITLWFTFGLGILDEGVQYLLPNRVFDWNDLYLNVFGALLGIGSVAILMRYRRDKPNFGDTKST